MRRLALLFLALLVSGCAQPSAPAPDIAAGTGPIDLAGQQGLLLVDARTREVVLLSATAGPAWLSPSGGYVVWAETGYDVVRTPERARLVTPATLWARVLDNGSGVELAPGVARTRDLITANVTSTAPLPPAERAGAAWSAASEDLSVLGGEYAGAAAPTACRNQIALRAPEVERFFGCHLEIAADGRAGWTDGDFVRVRSLDGAIENVTAPAGSTAENPAFTRDGIAYLRVHGAEGVELVLKQANETVIAKTSGSQRLALHDASADGRYFLVAAFDPAP